jgi:peptide deformylase
MIITDKKTLEVVSQDTTFEYCRDNHVWDYLAQELKESKERGAPGLGLAGIQIGMPIRVAYLTFKYDEKDIIYKLINPLIKLKVNPIIYNGEGCLSIPDVTYNTDRYKKVIISFVDGEDGKEKAMEVNDVLAVAIQHEVDHMDGILIEKRQHRTVKMGRNDICFCGSGKKYKKCCLV